MDLRSGRQTSNFQGMIPTGSTSLTAPPSVRLQGLMRATRILQDTPIIRSAVSSSSVSSSSSSLISSSAGSAPLTYVSSSSRPPPPSCSPSSSHSSIGQVATPQEPRHAPNVIKLSPYHQAEPASQWWSLFMVMVAYFNMSELAALSAFPFYLGDIPKQWYFQLSNSAKSSLAKLKQAFLERFQKQKTKFDVNLLSLKQYQEETVDDYMARVRRLTTEYDLPIHLLDGITIQLSCNMLENEMP